jgi:hypothetical protein
MPTLLQVFGLAWLHNFLNYVERMFLEDATYKPQQAGTRVLIQNILPVEKDAEKEK